LNGDTDGRVGRVAAEHDSIAAIEVDRADPERSFRPRSVAVELRDPLADHVGRDGATRQQSG
jgi:hypothetical protein